MPQYTYTAYFVDKKTGKYVSTSSSLIPEGQSYDNIVDAPVKNAYGSSRYSAVDLSHLDVGVYNVTGYYRIDLNSNVVQVGNNKMIVTITVDKDNDNKIATYKTIEGGVEVTTIVSYDSTDNMESLLKTTLNSVYWNGDTANEVFFLRCTAAEFGEMQKSDRIFYYVTDTNQLWQGNNLLNNTSQVNAAVSRIEALEALGQKLEGADTVPGSVANKIKTAVDNLVASLTGQATIATKSGKVVTLKAGIAESGGIISNANAADITLAGVATTGKAEDVVITDVNENLNSSNVEDALAEIVGKIGDTEDANKIIMTHEGGTLLYTLYQGVQDESHKIGDINIPADMVATSGSLYTATAQDTDLIEGNVYIRMSIANGEPFYISVQDLIDVYVGTNAQTGVSIEVNNGVISATVRTLDGAKLDPQSVPRASLAAGVQSSLAKADSAVQEVVEGSQRGAVSVDGTTVPVHGLGTAAYENVAAFDQVGAAETAKSQVIGTSADTADMKTIEGVLKKLQGVVNGLDGSAIIASKSGNVVTLRAGITQEGGAVDNNDEDNIVLASVASTGAAVDASIADAGNLIQARNVEGALQEIMTAINDLKADLTWTDID